MNVRQRKRRMVARHVEVYPKLKQIRRHLEALDREINLLSGEAEGLMERENQDGEWLRDVMQLQKRLTNHEVVMREMWRIMRGTRFKETAHLLYLATTVAYSSLSMVRIIESHGVRVEGLPTALEDMFAGQKPASA